MKFLCQFKKLLCGFSKEEDPNPYVPSDSSQGEEKLSKGPKAGRKCIPKIYRFFCFPTKTRESAYIQQTLDRSMEEQTVGEADSSVVPSAALENEEGELVPTPLELTQQILPSPLPAEQFIRHRFVEALPFSRPAEECAALGYDHLDNTPWPLPNSANIAGVASNENENCYSHLFESVTVQPTRSVMTNVALETEEDRSDKPFKNPNEEDPLSSKSFHVCGSSRHKHGAKQAHSTDQCATRGCILPKMNYRVISSFSVSYHIGASKMKKSHQCTYKFVELDNGETFIIQIC